ncbi:hypothetical protein BY458DRAFT_446176 [Sporodiniella umbellata]|nr:hypothetical protein BY458DRAFT_446176 [Sporodiniella umbellata]
MDKVHLFVLEALEQPYERLPQFLWTFDKELIENPDQRTIIQIIQYILTDFSGKCYRVGKTLDNYERTFFIDRVVPIFQNMGDQTGLISFKWCEIFSQGFAAFSILNGQSSTTRYVDGMGYTVADNQECVVIESASGPVKERRDKTEDDSLKQLHTCICVLHSVISCYPNASINTMKKVLAFGINIVKTTIILSTLNINEAGDGYVFKELESCQIPTNYEDRQKYLRLFNFIANFILLLKDQNQVFQQLKNEHYGTIPIDKSFTIRSIFKN